jgi:hypothetical protein
MPDEQQTAHDSPAYDPAVQTPEALAYEPIEDEQDEWAEEPEDLELPARPRRRLLTPIPLALLGVLLIAGGFIAGVQVQKGQTSSGSTGGAPAGLASRFAALGGTSSTGKTPAGVPASGFPGAGTGAGRPRGLPGREHAVCDELRRQHRQGQNLAEHERDEDRQNESQRHLPR